jgi:hypothetical protein
MGTLIGDGIVKLGIAPIFTISMRSSMTHNFYCGGNERVCRRGAQSSGQ